MMLLAAICLVLAVALCIVRRRANALSSSPRRHGRRHGHDLHVPLASSSPAAATSTSSSPSASTVAASSTADAAAPTGAASLWPMPSLLALLRQPRGAAAAAVPPPQPLLSPRRALAAQGGRTLVRLEQHAVAALRTLPTSEWLGASPARDHGRGGSSEGGSSSGGGGSSGGAEGGCAACGEGGGDESAADVHCRICLQPYEVGEMIRWLPCTHRFHQRCIDHWLLRTQRAQQRSCPLCKYDPLAALGEGLDAFD